MMNVLLTGSVAFIITLMAIPVIMRVADEKKMFDVPDARKLHTRPIASLGGVGIFLGFFLSTLLSITGKEHPEFQYFFAAAIVIFFLGLKDDILIISPVKKFLGQLAAAAILIHLGHVRIDSMYGLLGYNHIPEYLSITLSYITIIVIINAFNLIDGVDGLAGSLGVLTTLLMGVYFYMAGRPAYALLAFSMAGSLIAFLYYNFHPAKIFMGDSGSLLLGMVNAILVLKFIAVAGNGAEKIPLASAAAIGFSLLIVPLLDTLRVFSIRICKGRSPFSPDRNHIHHLLLDRGLNHRSVTLSCVALNLCFILAAFLGRSLGPNILFLIMVTASYAMVAALVYLVRPVPKRVVSPAFFKVEEPTALPVTKVVALNNEEAPATKSV
jgi:UDP-GlcNAc:undecaprenyl-phosphate/decaprenyl-phosphate GlcNAc-1-phosphate transferase